MLQMNNDEETPQKHDLDKIGSDNRVSFLPQIVRPGRQSDMPLLTYTEHDSQRESIIEKVSAIQFQSMESL